MFFPKLLIVLCLPFIASAQQTISDEVVHTALELSAEHNTPVLAKVGNSALLVNASTTNQETHSDIAKFFGIEGMGYFGTTNNANGSIQGSGQPRIKGRLFDDRLILYSGYNFGAPRGDRARYGSRFVFERAGEYGSVQEYWIAAELSPGSPDESEMLKDFQTKDVLGAGLFGVNLGDAQGHNVKARAVLETGFTVYKTSPIQPKQFGFRVGLGIGLEFKGNK